MTAKEYLRQAYCLDMRINSKIQQIDSLNELATKCTATISDMPRSPNRAVSTMANAVDKIVDLESEINEDINRLVDLKREIMAVIKNVDEPEYQTILEKRYLCFWGWEKIASDMGYDLRWLYRLHNKALKKVKVPTRN